MFKQTSLAAIFSLILSSSLHAQTIFVDPLKGKDTEPGTATAPLATLGKAIAIAAAFSGKEPVLIKLFPGLYTLTDKLVIQLPTNRENGYSVEAVTLPDDTGWTPSKMPVIQSISANNSDTQFPHSVGFLVATDDVSFRGLKFIGNANPTVKYYYPVTKEDSLLTGLEVSQCYFTGDRYSAPIQGGVWAHGPNTTIDHCLFYNCNNALLFFKGVQHFSVTNTIIYGAYEAAMWVWLLDGQFTFRNNVIADCDYFWTIPEAASPKARFENSLFLNVTHDAGNWKGGLVPASNNSFVFENTQHNNRAKVLKAASPDKPDLPFIPEADNIGAGLFKVRK